MCNGSPWVPIPLQRGSNRPSYAKSYGACFQRYLITHTRQGKRGRSYERDKLIQVSESCTIFLACLRVHLLSDRNNISGISQNKSMIPSPPQYRELLQNHLTHFLTVLFSMQPCSNPAPVVPQVPLATKLPLPLSTMGKLRAIISPRPHVPPASSYCQTPTPNPSAPNLAASHNPSRYRYNRRKPPLGPL